MSNSQLYLNSTLFLFAILNLIIPVSTDCPAPSLHGFIISGQIVAALNDGALPLREGQDHLCYNYSLPYQLSRSPEIALSVSGFQVEPSQKLNFYIKPIKSDSFSSISFVIRLQWLYTKWSQLTFNFIMEDRTDIQSGYYLIDTGPLVGCGTLKSTEILLPFRTILNMKKNIKHSVFLHGFEITTVLQERLTENKNQNYNNIRNSLPAGPNQKYNNSTRTPFQIYINNSYTNASGIVFTIFVSTLTKVDSLYVGYVAMENGGFRYTAGTYIFNYNQQQLLAHEPSPSVSRNYARIYGINGFLIYYKNQALSFNTNWNSFAFLFNFNKYQNSVQYFSFSYVFFLGSECDQCPGYPFLNDNTCVKSCPAATFLTEQNFCINCGLGRQWNGTTCVLICPSTQYLNQTTNLCQCPPTLNWNGQYCMACTNNRTFNPISKTCQCPGSLIWNSQTCIRKPECTSGRIFDIFTYSCICSEFNYWNGTSCSPIPTCKENQILNSQFLCVCKEGYHWNGQVCDYSPCQDGQLWTGTNCYCPIGLYFNGTRCIQCINGQKWNKFRSKCECQGGYKWNGLFCQKNKMCQGNRVWDQTYKQCICSKNSYWSGYTCIPIPLCASEQYFDIILLKCVCQSGFNFDGFNCIKCQNDKVWNFTTLKCVCPQGSTSTPNGCSFKQACGGGKVWVLSTRSCQCPAYTVWNGNACISNPCPFGKRWNFQFRSCQCLNNTIEINGVCMPPQITCTNGRVWNPVVYACECPPNTFLNYARCDEIPKCLEGKIYNPIINQCVCPRGLVQSFSRCVEPECGEGQYYNGLKCQIIRCPPPSYFKNNRCISGPASKNCDFSQYWNGQRCVYYSNNCPFGTRWERQRCISNGTCKIGEYSKNGVCFPLPQKCFPPLIWNGKSCKFGNNLCPNGTFWSLNKCIPFNECKNGAVWDSTYMKCLCPIGTISNGVDCIQCDKNKIWNIETGCACPEGTFDVGGSCEAIILESKCQTISNAIWKNKKCVCRPGFIKVNLQCVCYGIQNGGLCDRCSHKPNSQWVSSSKVCQCIKGYIQYQGSCFNEKERAAIGEDQSSSCTISTYFNPINKMCLPCPQGCLSCNNSYICQVCRPQFFYEPQTDKCIQLCGDGKKFSLECDDGNNNDNDGCSRDCRIEEGFYCLGGSPESKDSCYLLQPKQVKMELIGQIRQHSSITLNVKLNYIPILMIKKSDCLTSCNFFNTTIISGDKSAASISSKYVQGTRYVFAINIQFGKPYIGSFQVQVSINPKEVSQYFGTVSTKSSLIVPVNPAYLSTIQLSDKLF